MIGRRRIRHFLPTQLAERVTPVGSVFETSSMGVPEVEPLAWTLEITGLVERPTCWSLDDLNRLPKETLEAVFVCSGNPLKPTVPLRRVANVKWGGVDLARLLDLVGVRPGATHLWSYGLDHGSFFGVEQRHYVKDMPLSRLTEGKALIAYELNGAPLTRNNGFPARLVVPGFYGTNCVKWICRIALMRRRPSEFQTIRMYNDGGSVGDTPRARGKPVWAIAPESIIVSPSPRSCLARAETEIWGWAWSDRPVQSVEVSVDGGQSWFDARVEPAVGHAWQRFSVAWLPARTGPSDLHCRATDASGRTQPIDGARNAIQRIDVIVAD
jgi:sulfane dehydrogenase subunit SoxC